MSERPTRYLLASVVTLAASSAPALACVLAEGEFSNTCRLSTCAIDQPRPDDWIKQRDTASSMANAVCTADTGLVSTIRTYAHRDATAHEITTSQHAALRNQAVASRFVLALGVPVRKGDPVLLRIAPMHLGDPKPVIVAVVRGTDTKAPTIEWVVAPWR